MKFAFFLLPMVAIVNACWEKGKPRPELVPGSVGSLDEHEQTQKVLGDVAPIATYECLNGPYLNSNLGAGVDDALDPQRPGIHQCISPWKEGNFVTGLEIWSSDWHIHGIKFLYNGTQSYTIGVQNCGDGDCTLEERYRIIKFDGNPITMFKISDNSKHGSKIGDAVAGIYMEVGVDKIMVGPQSSDMKVIDVGTGNMLGAKAWVDGRDGTADPGGMVRSFVPFFLGNVQDTDKVPSVIAMEADFDLDALNKNKTGLYNQTLDEMFYINENFPNGTKWTFAGKEGQQWMRSYSTSNKKLFGGKTSIHFSAAIQVPTVATFTTGFGQEFEYVRSWDSTFTEDEWTNHETSWDTGSLVTNSPVPMGFAVHCVASAGKGVYTGYYKEKVEIEVDGAMYEFNRTGTQKRTTWTSGIAYCKLIEKKDVPTHAKGQLIATSEDGEYDQLTPPWTPDEAAHPVNAMTASVNGPANSMTTSVNAPVSVVGTSVKPLDRPLGTPVGGINSPAISTLATVVSAAVSSKPATASTRRS